MIEPFLKYERENIKEMQGLIDIQQDFFKIYLKRSNYESIDERMPYTSDKVKTYKAGVLTESKNMLVFKYQVACSTSQVQVDCLYFLGPKLLIFKPKLCVLSHK